MDSQLYLLSPPDSYTLNSARLPFCQPQLVTPVPSGMSILITVAPWGGIFQSIQSVAPQTQMGTTSGKITTISKTFYPAGCLQEGTNLSRKSSPTYNHALGRIARQVKSPYNRGPFIFWLFVISRLSSPHAVHRIPETLANCSSMAEPAGKSKTS